MVRRGGAHAVLAACGLFAFVIAAVSLHKSSHGDTELVSSAGSSLDERIAVLEKQAEQVPEPHALPPCAVTLCHMQQLRGRETLPFNPFDQRCMLALLFLFSPRLLRAARGSAVA